MRKNSVVFEYSLAGFDIQTAGVMTAAMCYGSTRHPNPLFKKIALLFVDDLRDRVNAHPSRYLKIDFTDYSLKDVVELGVAVHFLRQNPQPSPVLIFLDGLADAVLAEIERRRGEKQERTEARAVN